MIIKLHIVNYPVRSARSSNCIFYLFHRQGTHAYSELKAFQQRLQRKLLQLLTSIMQFSICPPANRNARRYSASEKNYRKSNVCIEHHKHTFFQNAHIFPVSRNAFHEGWLFLMPVRQLFQILGFIAWLFGAIGSLGAPLASRPMHHHESTRFLSSLKNTIKPRVCKFSKAKGLIAKPLTTRSTRYLLRVHVIFFPPHPSP